jgi:hypothetical protein
MYADEIAASLLSNKTLVTGLKVTVEVLKIAGKFAGAAGLPSLPMPPFPDRELMEMVDLLEGMEETGGQVILSS